MFRLARLRGTWPLRLSHNLRQPNAMVLYSALHSLPQSLAETAPLIPTSDSGEVPRATAGPEVPKGRNLVLCFDGTGEQYDKDNTNIVRFFRLLKKGDPSRQMVYYQAGIGTGISNSGPSNPLLKQINYILDQAFATGLPMHVRGGYEFLMNNYQEGDRISLFGFSRGAYTALALAGMLQKVGLLPAHNKEQIKYAYKMFQRVDQEGWQMSNGFKRTFSIDVKIDFVGVFDTINSVGIIPHELPFEPSNYLIRVFRHAVALDECRAKFKAHLWDSTPGSKQGPDEGSKREKDRKSERHDLIRGGWSYAAGRNGSIPTTIIHRGGHDFAGLRERRHQTNVKEVWFAGAHSDVGGGAVLNGTPNHLARIPLRWMIRECFRNETGILFDHPELEVIGLTKESLTPPELKVVGVREGAAHEGEKPNNATDPMDTNVSVPSLPKVTPATLVQLNTSEDEKDAVQPLHDQLSCRWLWWILELLPLRHHIHHDTLRSWSSLQVNFGRPRIIPHQKGFPTYVHKSVLYRAQKMGYEPRVPGILKRPGVELVE